MVRNIRSSSRVGQYQYDQSCSHMQFFIFYFSLYSSSYEVVTIDCHYVSCNKLLILKQNKKNCDVTSCMSVIYHIYYHTIIKEIIVYIRELSPRTKYYCQSLQYLFIQIPLLSATANRVYPQLTLNPVKPQTPSYYSYNCIHRLPVIIR